jgi:hypothetical protein
VNQLQQGGLGDEGQILVGQWRQHEGHARAIARGPQ